MKFADVQKLHEAGLVTDDQRQKIVEHFKLKEDSNRFLVIISFVGAVLVAAGIVLLIAANWDAIPRGVKLVTGLILMLAAHAGGWWLRDIRQDYRKSGEALHLVGSLLFLGNIALVDQIYHLSTRPPLTFLLWWAGIAALPWLLRSKAQHLLALLAFGMWFGFEINQADSLIRLRDEYQVLAYSLLGLAYVGFGYVLRQTTFASFAKVTERLGLVTFLVFAYPLTWQGFLDTNNGAVTGSNLILPALAAIAVSLVAFGARSLELDRQWRWTWGLTLAVAAALLVVAFFAPNERIWGWHNNFTPTNAFAAVALFVFCLLQIQVGLQERSTFLVNLGIAFIALDMIAAYIGLFGTMARTGLMFVVSGVFLIGFGLYLENKRRSLMKQIRTAKPGGLSS
ncbi:MAG: DUF2157 domain-containing protein [Verrucomicrobia bacterium]|nr:DUF2157 domain-containing protein [Verrucomicrobiota bacterium]